MYNTLMQPGETARPGDSPRSATPTPPPTEPNQQWRFTPEQASSAAAAVHHDEDRAITWTASEYVANQKTYGWYVLLGLGALAAATLIFLITRDKVSTGVIVLVGIIFGITAAHQPRTLEYRLDHNGIKIGDKLYPYSDFKSFSVMEDGAINSILLLPLKRFMPGLSIYYPPDQEEDILAVLGSYLPHETREIDAIDRLMRKIRF